uniref:PDZ domain-containing protein n=1 Tax=Meloidogyne javanica TaxID=6303 RepID=A0A915MXZ3_MELJA
MSEQPKGSTKVYYHLDDSTPYMSELMISPDRLTLGDFKRAFNRKGYSYFCKEWDPNLKREVKVEIVNDRQLLRKSPPPSRYALATTHALTIMNPHKYQKLVNGLFELFLLSQQNSTQPFSNTTSNMGADQESDLQTLISKRAGENLAEMYNSTSEDPYNRTSVSSSSIFQRRPLPGAPMPSAESTAESAAERTLLVNTSAARQKRLRKQRYVPSTISSESESTYSLPRIEEVKLRLQDAPLGISVASQCGSIFIYHIQHGSAAERCCRLEVGDQIVQIDETRFEDLNEKQALEVLKKLNSVKKTITMYVAKRARTNGGESSEDHKSDPLSLLCETQQLDISQWVESTTNKNCVEQVRPFAEIPPVAKVERGTLPIDGCKVKNQTVDETSDEEKAAYLDRRNGVGARLVPIIHQVRFHQQQQQQQKSEEMHKMQMINLENNPTTSSCPVMLGTLEESSPHLDCHPPLIQLPLHAAMDPKIILFRMVEFDSGLEIRNRKWLKIPVP